MSDLNKIYLVLTESKIFKSLTEDELLQLAKICKIVNYKPGELIFSEAQPANSFYVSVKGIINLVFDSKKIIQVSKGDVFGDWAILNETVRLATSKAINHAEVIEIDAIKFKDHQIIDAKISFKLILEMAKGLVGRLQSKSQVASKILINGGETDTVEFKSTIRKNLHTGKKDTAIEMAVLKTIAGFLNNEGGVLFIGVKDNQEILGIQEDEFLNEDKALLHLSNLINAKMGNLAMNYIHFSIVHIENKVVIRVDCTNAHSPIYIVDNDNEYFYVRNGVQTVSLSISAAVSFIKQKF